MTITSKRKHIYSGEPKGFAAMIPRMNDHQRIADAVGAIAGITRETNGTIAGVVGVSPAQFSARMNLRVGWRVEDLSRLADHWGVQTWDLMMGPARAVEAFYQARPESMRLPKSAGQSTNPYAAEPGLSTRAA